MRIIAGPRGDAIAFVERFRSLNIHDSGVSVQDEDGVTIILSNDVIAHVISLIHRTLSSAARPKSVSAFAKQLCTCVPWSP